MNILIQEYQNLRKEGDFNKILHLLSEALHDSSLNDEQKIRIKTVLADTYNQLNQYKEAVSILHSVDIHTCSLQTQYQYYTVIGHAYFQLSDAYNAYIHIHKALEIAEKNNIQHDMGVCYNYLGCIFHLMGSYKYAISYFVKCVRIYNNSNKPNSHLYEKLYCINNIANCLIDIGKYHFAIKFIKKALELNVELNNPTIKYISLRYLMLALINQKKITALAEPLAEFKKLNLPKSKEEWEMYDKVFSLYFTMYTDIHNPNIHQLATSLETRSTSIQSPQDVIYVYNVLIEYFQMQKNFEKAFHFLTLINQLKQTMRNEQTTFQIMHLNHQYDVVKIQNENLLQQKISDEKYTFLSIMSHEIRNPIHLVVSALQLAKLNTNDDKRNYYISKAETETQSLLRHLNDLLDLSRIESNNLEFEYKVVPIHSILQEWVMDFKMHADIKNSTITYISTLSDEYMFYCDPIRIRQVLLNLFHNAMKYTDMGEIIFQASTIDNMLQIIVQDTGIGIAPERIPHLFTFSSSKSNDTSQREGSRLGLSICKRIIEHCNGTITVDSKIGKGTKITIQLPNMN